MATEQPNLGRWARAFTRRGLLVFPCHWPVDGGCSCGDPACSSPGKHPRTKRGLLDATTDEETVQEWWDRFPEANIGCAVGASGRLVIDIDPRNGGTKAWEAVLEQEGVEPPETFTVGTGGGGTQLYFLVPDDLGPVRKQLAPGVDIKANGGYTIVPPSLHVSGARYEVASAKGQSSVELPGWLRALVEKPAPEPRAPVKPQTYVGESVGTAYGRRALEEEVAAVRNAPEGTRNNQLNESAFACGQLEAGGQLAPGVAEEELRQAASNAGLGETEIDATLASGFEAGLAEPRSAPEKPAPSPGRKEGTAAIEQPAELENKTDSDSGDTTRKTQATKLVELAEAEAVELFHDDERTFARLTVNGHRETYPLRRSSFGAWLARQFYFTYEKVPGAQAVQEALAVLDAKARLGPETDVWTRLAVVDGAVYLDLSDPSWQAVEITANGWNVVSDPPVAFRRSRGMRPLPVPAEGGSVDDLRELVNLEDDDQWQLNLAWLVAALRGRGPFPVLTVNGEQGSAKSTLVELNRALIDPSKPLLRAEPREVRDLMIAAANSWVVSFDNVSKLPPWLSDALCRLATGGGFGVRQLYSDDEEAIFEARRPCQLNGIEEVAVRGDLLDRSLLLTLPSIPDEHRRPESEIWAEFEQARPGILGALLGAVVGVLRDEAAVKLDRLPRMADFAIVATAAERALGWKPGSFLKAYDGNRAAAHELTLEQSPVAQAVRVLAEEGGFEGRATELLEKLEALADESARTGRGWPRTPHHLSGHLRRLAPNLRAVGIEVTFPDRKAKERNLTVRNTTERG